uniref:Ubiquitin thioesterase OTU n=1 Tax=Pyrodinium bahamense TaxID=73915 RepID=A0A7S0AL88_9DINO|mmetsp:Transcript_37095/g.103223  ORF Transcript_37095/g.103223 Transcript_37095/m.103223 type:complete len:461 (+) Transcript_37095:54-1436(+)
MFDFEDLDVEEKALDAEEVQDTATPPATVDELNEAPCGGAPPAAAVAAAPVVESAARAGEETPGASRTGPASILDQQADNRSTCARSSALQRGSEGQVGQTTLSEGDAAEVRQEAAAPSSSARAAAVTNPAVAAEPPRPAWAPSVSVPTAAAPASRCRAAVGEHFASVARVLMREGEALTSNQVGYVPAHRLLEVLEVGKGRRVRVLEETGMEGWVSLSKETGELLLAPRQLNARQAFNFRRVKEDRKAKASRVAVASIPGMPSAPSVPGFKCDKCDGPHATDACPFFKKEREDHKDAWANYGQTNPLKMGGDGGDFTLRGAKVVRQPGDGSCLFHSLSFGLSSGHPNPHAAEALRWELAAFIERNPQTEIAGDTIEEWVRWDANSTVSAYAQQMGRRGWGGGVEMAVCSLLKAVNVHVYEHATDGAFKRISCFDAPGSKKTLHVLYQGRCHYDALVPAV